MERETARQLFHMIVGVIAMVMLYWFGRGISVVIVFGITVLGLWAMNARLLKSKSPFILIIEFFEKKFERTNAPLPGWGSACYSTGVLIVMTVLSDITEISAVIFILAVGDSLSTIVGQKGRIKLPYNGKKTLEGSLVFFLSSLPVYFFLGPIGIIVVIICTIVETLPLLDDNLTIPMVATAALVVF